MMRLFEFKAIICAVLISTLTGIVFAEEVRYLTHIKPIMDNKCIKCHGADTPEYDAFKAEKDKWLSMNKVQEWILTVI